MLGKIPAFPVSPWDVGLSFKVKGQQRTQSINKQISGEWTTAVLQYTNLKSYHWNLYFKAKQNNMSEHI